MRITHEIADLSARKLVTLKTYISAVADGNPDLDQLAKELADLTNQRQTAYAHFRELAGLKTRIGWIESARCYSLCCFIRRNYGVSRNTKSTAF